MDLLCRVSGRVGHRKGPVLGGTPVEVSSVDLHEPAQLFQGLVERSGNVLGVDVDEARRDPEHQSFEGAALLERCFGLSSLRDISAHADDLAHRALFIEHGSAPPGQPAPTLVGHDALVHADRIGRREVRLHGLGGRRPVVLVDERQEALSQELLFGLAEGRAARWADEQKVAFGIDFDHEIVLVLHQ